MNRLLSIFAICLFHLGLFAQDGQGAASYTSGYYVQGGEIHAAGDRIDIGGLVFDESGSLIDGTVATLTFGVAGDNDFYEANRDNSVNGFEAYVPGNGVNGRSDGGTVYIIRPNYNGYINVGVVQNANKMLYILEDEVAMEGYNGLTVDEQYRGLYGFPVKAGSTYKIYASGSKLGFYGFEFLYTPDSFGAFEVYNLTVSTNAKINVYYYPQGTSQQIAGNNVMLETYSWNSYRFKYWTANGEIVSTDQYFSYTMPQKDVNMVAVYEFNPSNPGDPASAENSYKLTLESQPAKVGSFNLPKVSKQEAGKTTWIYPYSNKSGYVFKEWQIDGKRISTQHELEFVMPERNVTLTAVFEFKPTSPGNPGTNLFVDGELMLDDFTPGDAWSAAYNATSGNFDQVYSAILIGEVGERDASSIVANCPNLTSLDVSRTTGMKVVREYAFSGYTQLNTISLPASIGAIGDYAFNGCSSLTAINLHALTPPAISSWAFGDDSQSIVKQVTVFVPAASLSLYENAEVWKDLIGQGLQIRPLGTDVRDLEINLPEGTDASLYKDMYLEAVNTKSGQSLRYVMTNSLTYTFNSIIKNTTWNIYLKNAKGEVLGTIENVEVKNENVSKTFESLETPQNVTLTVFAGDDDVTDQTTITWSDAAGNFLAQGETIKNLLKGNVVQYSVTLPEDLAMQYQLPEGGSHKVEDGDIQVTLKALPKLAITGTVIDYNKSTEDNLVALPGAIVAVSQTINGKYSKTYTAKTDAEGKWSLKEDVYVAPTEITASKVGYISETKTFETLSEQVIDNFALRDINGTTINLTLTYQTLNGEQKDYDDVANVTYTVVKATTGETLTDLSFQESKIVMQDKLEHGTLLILTATSKNQKFMPVTVNAIVDNHDKANVTFFIKQLGGIQATYGQTENSGACVGILYDANGQFVKRYEYNGNNLVIDELKDGNYTLVTMANSQLFNTVGQLSQFAESGLRNGVDYVRNNVTVKSGDWTVVNIAKVPYLDETKLYYTSVNTSFSANKSQVTAGQYLTLRGQVDFKDAYAGKVSNVELIVNLTDDCEFVDNSVMLGKNLTSYTLNGKQLIVPIGTSKEQVRFCVIPTKEGTYEPSASVSFNIGGKKVLQPIGSAQTTVKGVTINVPATIATPQFTASGTAIAKSDVYVYVDDMLMGKTTVKANGKWSMQCTLVDDATDKAEHPVYARVVTPEKAELLTDTKTVTLDENAILAKGVNMSFYNGWLGKTVKVDWDMIEKKVNPASYMFYTTTDFTFTISFTRNPEEVTGVQLIVYKNNNSYDILNAQYNQRKQIWVVSQRYSSWALPTAVKVKYLINGQQQTLSEDKDDEGIEHSNPILDPSGYVYEAVSSNRLQGVTASIYYKEEKKDMYGESYWVENLWNAEDYAQVNPQFTDENGMYQWDVPNGLWQVRLEKEGYLQTKSEWLPVPPPQLDINLPMTRTSKPEVQNVKASSEGVEITFNMYMDPETLIPYNFNVTQNGNTVEGEIQLLNEEEAYKGASQTYASKVFFKFNEELPSGDGLQLTVKKAVKSYAGISMQDDKSQDFAVELVVRRIIVDSDIDLVNVTYGETRTITVAGWPNEAAKGQKISVESLSELVATTDPKVLTLDENGQAELVITGELPGSTKLAFNVVGTDVRDTLTVNVKEAEKLFTIAPRASRVSGSKLYNGEKIQLSCETEDAVIKYTLDGSDPAEAGESVRTYKTDEPIVITSDNVTLKAIAEGKDMKPSEVAEFNYELKKSTIGYNFTGWKWISHNWENAVSIADFTDGIAANVERIVSQTSEVINDPALGLVGGLTELQPAVGYKIKVKADTDQTLNGYELNANENTVSVKAGWNWIGYPLNQVMTVNEALEYFEASKGDEIVGNDGTAVYDGETWNGDLQGLKPGQGYHFHTATAADIQFNTNIVSNAVNHVGKRNLFIGSPWTNDKYAYPNIMPLFAEFYVDGVKSDDGEFVVAAFAGDECRGVGQWIKGRLMMNVCGDGGEDITFMAYNKDSEQYFTVAEHVTFVSDNCGTWFAPTKLTLGNETTGMSEVNKDLFISIGSGYITVNAGGKNISSLTLTNMGGVTVLDVSDLGTGATITTGSLSDGMYIVTIKAEGKTYYEKILKGNK